MQSLRFTCRVLIAGLVLNLFSVVAAIPAQQQATPAASAPSKSALKTWRGSAVRAPRPRQQGCFRAQYPDITWTQTNCRAPPNIPFRPHHGGRGGLEMVGDGTDFSLQIPGTAAIMEGSFDVVSGLTDETGAGTPNAYSLQLNSEFFPTSTCASGQSGCEGWEQFIFYNLATPSESFAFIQYWMVGYGASCPHGWLSGGGADCYRNSTDGVLVPVQTIDTLAQMTLTGVASSASSNDSVTLSIGGVLYSVTGNAYFPDFSQHWNTSEFNVFGPGASSQAVFNTGASITVRTEVDGGSATPICLAQGFTAESNNLTLTGNAAGQVDAGYPSIVFTQSNPGATSAACADFPAEPTSFSDGPVPWWATLLLGAALVGIGGHRLKDSLRHPTGG